MSDGPLLTATKALVSLIANVPSFQTWTGAADANAAALHVYDGEVGYSIQSVSITGGVATITLREQHEIGSSQVIELAGASIGPQSGLELAGQYTVSSAAASTVLIPTTLPDTEAPVYPERAFVIPTARPFAVVCEPSESLRGESIGTGGASIVNGSLEILLEADVTEEYVTDPANALGEARAAFGNFVQDLMRTQGTGDLMCLNSIETVSGPQFTSSAEQDNNPNRFERWRAMVRVTWGMES